MYQRALRVSGWYHGLLMTSPLEDAADNLEAEIDIWRIARREARELAFGRLFTTGRLPVLLEWVDEVGRKLGGSKMAGLLGRGMLEQHGYTVRADKHGQLWVDGPTSCPEGEPPLPGSVIPVDGASSGAGGGGGSTGSGGGTSVAEASREVKVRREYADWQAQVRRVDIWEQYQAERAYQVGRALHRRYVKDPGGRKRVQRLLRESDPAGAERWSDEELRVDYPAELGEDA